MKIEKGTMKHQKIKKGGKMAGSEGGMEKIV
jgi:hypothetical protein